MILVTGPLFAGKQTYSQDALGWTEEEFEERGIRDVQELAAAPAGGEEPEDHEERMKRLQLLADELSRAEVILSTETGAGVIPVDRVERQNREAAGILSRLLAERADLVIRVSCGLPQFLKGSGEDLCEYRRKYYDHKYQDNRYRDNKYGADSVPDQARKDER